MYDKPLWVFLFPVTSWARLQVLLGAGNAYMGPQDHLGGQLA